MPFNKLTQKEEQVIVKKGTEAPYSGKYDNFYEDGTFLCRRCNSPLFSSYAKFDAGCGWPAFDENFPRAVTQTRDVDGSRIEITCTNCAAHLGHVFTGEHMTEKNTRHCVNSVALKFVKKDGELPEVLAS